MIVRIYRLRWSIVRENSQLDALFYEQFPFAHDWTRSSMSKSHLLMIGRVLP